MQNRCKSRNATIRTRAVGTRPLLYMQPCTSRRKRTRASRSCSHRFLIVFQWILNWNNFPNNPRTWSLQVLGFGSVRVLRKSRDFYKFWGSAPCGFFENPMIFDPWGQPWGPLEAEGRPLGKLWENLVHNGPFEPITGLRHYSSWIPLVFWCRFMSSIRCLAL